MGKQNGNETLRRQWYILQMLDNQNSLKTSEIQERLLDIDDAFDVDIRTIQRDLNNLSSVGLFNIDAEEDNNDRKALRWRWKNSNNSLTPLSENDAMLLLMVGDYLQPLLPKIFRDTLKPQMERAKQKLRLAGSSAGANRIRDKTRIVHPTLNMRPPKLSPIAMEQIKNALMENKQLKVIYQSLNRGEERTYRLNPLGLVLRGPATYLIATANDHQNPILFAVHRIKKIDPLDDKISTPPGFDLDEYIRKGALNFGDASGTLLSLKLRIKPTSRLGNILAESPLSDDQRLSEHEGVTYVEASVPDTWQLKWWLMQHANEITVEKPASLKKEIIKRLKDALEQYERQ